MNSLKVKQQEIKPVKSLKDKDLICLSNIEKKKTIIQKFHSTHTHTYSLLYSITNKTH